MTLEEKLNAKYNYDFKESLERAKVLLTGHNTGVYNPYYKTHIFASSISIKEGETIENVKRRVSFLLSQQFDDKFETRVKPTNLATVIDLISSGNYRKAVFKTANTDKVETAKEFAQKIHSFDDKKYSDTYKYIENDEIKSVKTNDATNHTNGFIFFDLDFPKDENMPNYIPASEKDLAVQELKTTLYENLKQYNWFVMDCTSTSGNGVHVYTYNLISPSFSPQQRLLYWQNCYQIMEQAIIQAIGKDKSNLLDHCSSSVSQGVNLTLTDQSPFINENFRLRPNVQAFKLAMSNTAFIDTFDAICVKTRFKSQIDIPTTIKPTINIDGMPSLDEAPYYFRHGKWNGDIPPLGATICYCLYFFGYDKTIELGKLGIYKSDKKSLSESIEVWCSYASSMRYKDIAFPSPYLINWAEKHLKVNLTVDDQSDELDNKRLSDDEYASKYMLDDLEAITVSKDYNVVKIVVDPAGGKTEAAKEYGRRHNIDIIVPYNPLMPNKFADFYQVSSITKNEYDPTQTCVMIPDQWLKNIDDIDKDMVIVDEIHQIWLDQSYRVSCEKFLELVKSKYKKVILLTGTPMGEDASLPPDLTISYKKKQPLREFNWITAYKKPKSVIKSVIEEAIEESDFIGIYADRYFSSIEELTREMADLGLCKPFLYAAARYKQDEELDNFMHSHYITDKYQGIVYTKFLGAGHDILDEGKVTVIAIKSDQETGGTIYQAAARFRKADYKLKILEIERHKDIYKNTQDIVDYANSVDKDSLEHAIAEGLVYGNKSVSVDDNKMMIINERKMHTLDSIYQYGNDYSYRPVINKYLSSRGFIHMASEDRYQEGDGDPLKAAFRNEDHAFISENITQIYNFYKQRRLKSSSFDEFMTNCAPDDECHFEDNIYYIHNPSYALSILRKLWALDMLGISNLENIGLLTNFKPESIKQLIIFVNWNNRLKDLPKSELSKMFDLKEDDFKITFLRKVLKITPAKYDQTTGALILKKLEALYKKYKSVVDQIYSVFKLYESDQSILDYSNEQLIEKLAKQEDLAQKEKTIQRRKRQGSRVINLQTKAFYNSINEACEAENISKKALLKLAAEGKYKIEKSKTTNGKKLINPETKEVYDSILDAVAKTNQSKYMITKLIKENKLNYYDEEN